MVGRRIKRGHESTERGARKGYIEYNYGRMRGVCYS